VIQCLLTDLHFGPNGGQNAAGSHRREAARKERPPLCHAPAL